MRIQHVPMLQTERELKEHAAATLDALALAEAIAHGEMPESALTPV